MSKEHAREKCENMQVGWQGVLVDAELALREAKARVRAVKNAIRKIQDKVRAGESLPDYLKRSTQN